MKILVTSVRLEAIRKITTISSVLSKAATSLLEDIQALRQGMETWAAVRPTSSRKYLQDERIHFINLNLSSEVIGRSP